MSILQVHSTTTMPTMLTASCRIVRIARTKVSRQQTTEINATHTRNCHPDLHRKAKFVRRCDLLIIASIAITGDPTLSKKYGK
ncbi:MAG: hypothetical protein IKL29_00925 [Bacteroidaceae bacterium]|nr:hypothetical protein [Bacteroidaceae bacterium]